MVDRSSEQLKSMSITEHLLEFRKRLMLIIAGIVVCIAALSPFMKELFDYASAPIMSILPDNSQLLAVGVTAPVMGPLKVLLFSAFFISLPYTLYQIWAFVVPALYKKEKKDHNCNCNLVIYDVFFGNMLLLLRCIWHGSIPFFM